MALRKDTHPAGRADTPVEPPEERGDRLALGREGGGGPELSGERRPGEHFQGRIAQPVKIEPAAARAPAPGLAREEFRPRDVDEVHALGKYQKMLLRRTPLLYLLQVIGHVVHGAEVKRSLDPQHAQLRALGFARPPLAEFALPGSGIGDDRAQRGARGAVQVKHQREHDPEQHRDFEVHDQRGEEGRRQHRGLGTAGAHDGRYVRKVEQPPRHEEQDRRHRGDRDERGERRDREHDQHQGAG